MRITDLKSASLKARSLEYLWDREAEWSEVWGNVFGGREKVRQSVFCAGISELYTSSWDACLENSYVSMI